MRFDIMTLFPEMVMNGLETSIIGRAVKNKILEIEAWNIRDYAFNKHSSVDDYPYGGGAGMLMQAEPVYQTYLAIQEKAALPEGKRPRVIYLSPQGKPFNQKYIFTANNVAELFKTLLKVLSTTPNIAAAKTPARGTGRTVLTRVGYTVSALLILPPSS